MGRIKSALEIALEKTESVKSDKNSINQFKAKQQGKKIANDFLSGELHSLEQEIKKSSKEEVESLKQGIFEALITQITLPLDEEDLKRVETAGQGLHTIINNPKFNTLLKQLSQALSQYLKESVQYEEAIMRQYAPKLRQKEEELSRRMGRPVKIDPFQDPEFAAFFNQNMNALKTNYQAALNQVREEAGRLFPGK
jgi:predicted component of type VI protein secretion system